VELRIGSKGSVCLSSYRHVCMQELERQNDTAFEDFLYTPTRRVLPGQYSNLLIFLCSGKCSFITSSFIKIDYPTDPNFFMPCDN